jgi:hypothetical protein
LFPLRPSRPCGPLLFTLLHAGPDESERYFEAELQQIDARFPDHPWVTQIEQRRPGEPLSA